MATRCVPTAVPPAREREAGRPGGREVHWAAREEREVQWRCGDGARGAAGRSGTAGSAKLGLCSWGDLNNTDQGVFFCWIVISCHCRAAVQVPRPMPRPWSQGRQGRPRCGACRRQSRTLVSRSTAVGMCKALGIQISDEAFIRGAAAARHGEPGRLRGLGWDMPCGGSILAARSVLLS